jgi:ribose-phosphate pyrophosphokinase
MKEIAIISGSSNKSFAEKIAKSLHTHVIDSKTTKFSDGERMVEINESVRDKDVFVVQSSSDDTDGHLIELFLILDALKRSSCYRVTAVIPNFPYARQDRKVRSRVPVSAKLLANLLTTAGVDRILTADLHAPQIGGFFDIPVDNLYGSIVFLELLKKKYPDNNICIVAPDAGSVKRAKMYAGRLDCEVAMIYKHRTAPGEIGEMMLIGNVEGKNCIIIDDMADTCGTLCRATEVLINNDAKQVEACCTHAILSGSAFENLDKSKLKNLYVTDTINNKQLNGYKEVDLYENIKILSIASLFAEAINGIHHEQSLSYLFDY